MSEQAPTINTPEELKSFVQANKERILGAIARGEAELDSDKELKTLDEIVPDSNLTTE